MANSWSKQPVWVGGYINNVNDAVIGGQLTTVPGSVPASQAEQTLPGDHVVLDEAAAQAKSTTASGFALCHGGYYQYVQLDSAASTVFLGQALYWKDTSVLSGDTVYTVTNNQVTNIPALAGFVLNPNWTAGNYSWMQCLGRVTALIDAASGAVSIGSSLSLSTSTGTSNGSLTVSTSTSATAPAYFVGIAEVALATPSAGSTTLVDVQKVTLRF